MSKGLNQVIFEGIVIERPIDSFYKVRINDEATVSVIPLKDAPELGRRIRVVGRFNGEGFIKEEYLEMVANR